MGPSCAKAAMARPANKAEKHAYYHCERAGGPDRAGIIGALLPRRQASGRHPDGVTRTPRGRADAGQYPLRPGTSSLDAKLDRAAARARALGARYSKRPLKDRRGKCTLKIPSKHVRRYSGGCSASVAVWGNASKVTLKVI